MIIVDNRSANYCEHIFNGIPITDYHGDHQDRALYELKEHLLKRVLGAEDVRKIVREDFFEAVIPALKVKN